MHVRAVLTLAVLLVPMLSAADVFRCTDAGGRVAYSDSPCVGGTSKVVLVNQNSFPAPPAREQALVDENRRLRGELDASRSAALAPAGPASIVGRTDADLAAEKSGSFECAQARRNFDVAASSREVYRNIQADELAVYVACGIRPPDRFVTVNGFAAGPYRPLTLRDARADRKQPRAANAIMGARGACASVGSRLGCL